MKAFRILVPFDNSNNSLRALTKANSLAKRANASITILHVVSYDRTIAKIVGPYKGKMIDHVKNFLNDAKQLTQNMGNECDTEILVGSPAQEILEYLKKNKYDLVVVGKRGTTKLTGPSLGSVSNALVQSTKIPVMVVK